MKDISKYQLCYIDNIDDWNTFKLYFTSVFEGQWGDDWNDRPANCNAEPPYTEGRDIYTIIIEFNSYGQITFGGKVYSVEDMNTKKACWLIYDNITFEGGDTLEEVYDKLSKVKDVDIHIQYRGDDI